jgi:hypothetical protein
MTENTVIIDAATRFLRSNPELLEVARRGVGDSGQAIEDLLTDTVRSIRRSGLEAVAEKHVIAGPPYRLDRGPRKRVGRRGPTVDDTRPRLVVVPARDSRRDGQEQLVHRSIGQHAAEQ